MIRIGIIGLGVMGRAHAAAYAGDPRAAITAVADVRGRAALEALAGGNLDGQDDAAALTDVRLHDTAAALLADDAVDAVSICTPTPDHPDLVREALARGLHVLVEKPLALDGTTASTLAAEAARVPELRCMPAMCMRFWPGWDWLRDAVADRRYGRVRAASFWRVGAEPTWGRSFYGDPKRCGGAILDLHIHDADFVRACFGPPDGVFSQGLHGPGGGVDHVCTSYRVPDGPEILTAEGAWLRSPAAPFNMAYRVSFEDAVARYQLRDGPTLELFPGDAETPQIVELDDGTGYDHEIKHFLDTITDGRDSDRISMRDAAEAVRLVEAERRSVESGAFEPFESAAG